MKTKSNLWRMLAILIIAILWGGGMSAFAEKKAWVKYDSNAKTLTFYYNEKGDLAKNEYEVELNNVELVWPAWTKYGTNCEDATKLVFDSSFANARPKNCWNWFNTFTNLKEIEGIKYLNTSEVISMDNMFRYCWGLKSIDLSNLDTHNVTTMSAMFEGVTIRSIDLSNLDLSNVKNMTFMFFNSDIETVKLPHSTSSLTGMYRMFKNSSLISIDLSNLNTSNLSNMEDTFDGCNKLTSVKFGNIDMGKMVNMKGTFKNCTSLTELDLSGISCPKLTDVTDMFNGCSQLKTIYATENFGKPSTGTNVFAGCTNLSGAIDYYYNWLGCDYATVDGGYFTDKQYTRPYVAYKDNRLYFNYGYKKDLKEGEFLLNKEKEEPGWLKYNYVTEVFFDKYFAHARPTSCYKWFSGFKNMYNYTFRDIENLNTSEVTRMDYMFENCTRFPKSPNILSVLDTRKVKTMEGMFKGCSSIESIDLSNFNTVNVTNIGYMFSGCSALKSLDLSKFNTGKITSMTRLFENCSSLESLNISGFNTANVTTAPSMFNGCSMLKTIDVSSFNTAKIDNMGHMFANCSSLTTLDLTNFNTSAVKWIDNMFKDCSNLTTIYASENFVLGNGLSNSAGMFTGCTKLVGAIAYDANTVDKTYAKLDGGYFTDKNCPPRPWVKLADGTLTFQYGYKKTLDSEEYTLNEAWDNPGWNSISSSVTKVVFDNTFAYARPTSCYRWFYNCSNLTDIEGIKNLNTSESEVLHLMFYNCKKLTSLNLSNFDTRNVTNMNWMFKGCSNLKNIYVSDKFVGGSTEAFAPSSTVFYCSPVQYNATKEIAAFASNTVRPYVNINASAEYGTLCVPLGSTLAESSYSGFDKLYRIKTADADKGVVTMEEVESIEPGVAYVYRRNLPEDATESIITFDVDASAATATAPNDDSLLKGTFELITAPGGSYILQTDGKFHPVAAGNTTLGVGAYRAYLDLSSLDDGNAKAFRMVFEDKETTGINGVSDQMERQPKTCYDLMGRRVTTPKRGGLYIVNGKKVVYNK